VDDFIKIVAIATHPDARGRGLASAILNEITARADAEGRAVFLEASPNGVEAFYRDRHGFETLEEMRFDFGERGRLDVPLMVRRPRPRAEARAAAAEGGRAAAQPAA
jgi:ribosomal protein S18 acetylase RimI-like enzyme